MCLAFHEAAEAVCCKHNGVSQKAVDDFDKEYDNTHASDLNAGDEPLAPYAHEHTIATAIERILAGELRVQWKEYDDELSAIPRKRPAKLKTESLAMRVRTRVFSNWGNAKSKARPRKKNH